MARRTNTDRTTRGAPGTDDDRAHLARLFEELKAIYAEVDAELAFASCPASTECCRFNVTGREPYVTSIELALVERAIAARGGHRALGKSPPPLSLSTNDQGSKRRLSVLDERVCPLLDESGRCSIYASRPLGCRTFWCDRASGADAVDQRALNGFVRRIKDIAARHTPEGEFGRPLTRALASPSAGPGPRRRR